MRVAVALLAAVSIVASCSDSGSEASQGSAATTVAPGVGSVEVALSAELALLRGANDGHLSKVDAVDLFASAFGQFPGGDPARFAGSRDGTMPLFELMGHWADLTVEQQAAVRGFIGLELSSSMMRSIATVEASAVRDEVAAARAAIAARVGFDLPFPIQVDEVDSIGEPRPDGQVLDGLTFPMQAGDILGSSGMPDACQINLRIDRGPSTVTHEVFHCFQYAMAGDAFNLWNSFVFVIEGSAAWAAATILGVDHSPGDFAGWIASHGSLTEMDYAGIGVFWVIESLGADVWTVVDDMLVHDATLMDTVAATGLDPARVVTAMAATAVRHQEAPTLDVSAAWDFGLDIVPSGFDRWTSIATAEIGWDFESSQAEVSRAPAQVVSLPEGERVDVSAIGGVGSVEFLGRDAEVWAGRFHEQFCLLEGGCRCGVGGSVDSGLRPGSRELVMAGGAVEAADLRFELQFDRQGFTDGHWTGQVSTTSTTFRLEDRVSQTRGDAGTFELTVENGAVTSGTYSLAGPVSITVAQAVAEGTGTLSGTIVGCGFSPHLVCATWAVDAVLLFPDGAGSLPLQTETPCDGGASATGWVFSPDTDPDERSGEIDPTQQLDIARSAGLNVTNLKISFTAIRDR